MNTRNRAVHNKATLESPRPWPRETDFLDVPRKKAVTFVEKFIASFGVEPLRERGNFRQMSWISPAEFDQFDFNQAFEVIIDTVNARCGQHSGAQAIKKSLEQYFGPLTDCIAVRVHGWHLIIEPKAVVQ